jgi:hypothetical protein
MIRNIYLAMIISVMPLVLCGCAGCQPGGSGSQAVDVNPFAAGTGQVVTPANGPGYMDGEPMDMRHK